MLYFVGVGPGDPELMTLKAVRLIREADAIALPDKGNGESTVMKIAGEYIGDKPVCYLHMPMKGNRADWMVKHDEAAQVLLDWLNRYGTIVYPVLGDPSVYASSSYLFRRISAVHPCKVVAGIPAMCAAAAELGIPLCEQKEELRVIDHLGENDVLPSGNTVIMKADKLIERIQSGCDKRKAYYVRNLGMDNESKGELSKAKGDAGAYFTTVIIKDEKYTDI